MGRTRLDKVLAAVEQGDTFTLSVRVDASPAANASAGGGRCAVPVSVFDASLPHACPALLDSFRLPAYFANDLLQRGVYDVMSGATES